MGTIDPELLAELLPVQELQDTLRENLACKGVIRTMDAGQRLEAAKEHAGLLYLLQGSLKLLADHKALEINAGTPRARHPLFTQGRLHDVLHAVTPCRLLRLDRKLFEVLREQQSENGYEIHDVDLGAEESEIFAEIYQDCMTGKLDLPVLPEVAVKIQQAIKNPNIDIKTLARIIETDVAVTGGLLRTANSAAYGGRGPVANVPEAIVRLGFLLTRRLVMTIAMRQVFRCSTQGMLQRLQQQWERSTQVAALAYGIAEQAKGLDPERALLCGLLHAVGVIPIIDHIARNHPSMSDASVDAVVGKLKGLVGEIILGYWGLDAEISEVVREAGNWGRFRSDLPDYGDVLLVAQLYYINHAHPEKMVPRFHEIRAYGKLNLGTPDADLRLPLLDKALAESGALTELLSAAS